MLTARFILRLRAYHNRNVDGNSTGFPPPQLSTLVMASIEDQRSSRTLLDEFDMDITMLVSREVEGRGSEPEADDQPCDMNNAGEGGTSYRIDTERTEHGSLEGSSSTSVPAATGRLFCNTRNPSV